MSLLLEAEASRVLSIEFLPVLENIALYRKKTLNRLPREFDDKSPQWFFLDSERKEPRLVLVAALRYQGQLRYLIEFMHPKDAAGGCSMLVLWDVEGGNIPAMILRMAIESCMQHTRISLAGCVEVSFCCGFRLKHSEGTSISYQSLLQKIFVHAQDEMQLLIDPVMRKAKQLSE